MSEKEKVKGSTIFLGNAGLAMTCILIIMTIDKGDLGFFRGLSLFIFSVTTPVMVGQYYLQFIFTGYNGNILVSIVAVALTILAYCLLVFSIRWYAGLAFSLSAWYYFIYVLKRMNKIASFYTGDSSSNTQNE